MLIGDVMTQFMIGIGGGVACELLHWYTLARKPGGVKPYMTKPVYWVCTAGMVLLGGFMPILYTNGPMPAILCFHLGASTPILLQKLGTTPPRLMGPQGARASLRSFFEW